jgi:hypothetical protein
MNARPSLSALNGTPLEDKSHNETLAPEAVNPVTVIATPGTMQTTVRPHNKHISFSSIEDLLHARGINKTALQMTTRDVSGPYPCKAAFVIANPLLYHINHQGQHASLNDAWKQYTTVTTAVSNQPAMLYKVIDVSNQQISDKKLLWFRNGDPDLVAAGRQYKPQEHNWDVNTAWVLAQLHRARGFTLLSNLSGSNIMRTHRAKQCVDYSAFTREVAAAMKANYTITELEYRYNDIIISLTPPTDVAELQRLNINKIIPNDTECQTAVEWVAGKRRQYESGIKIISQIKVMLELATIGKIENLAEMHNTKSTDTTDSDSENYNSDDFESIRKYSFSSSNSDNVDDRVEALESEEDYQAFQTKIKAHFADTLAYVTELKPIEIRYFIDYFNASRLPLLADIPALPQTETQAGFFKSACTPTQIAAIFTNALDARLKKRKEKANQADLIATNGLGAK